MQQVIFQLDMKILKSFLNILWRLYMTFIFEKQDENNNCIIVILIELNNK